MSAQNREKLTLSPLFEKCSHLAQPPPLFSVRTHLKYDANLNDWAIGMLLYPPALEHHMIFEQPHISLLFSGLISLHCV